MRRVSHGTALALATLATAVLSATVPPAAHAGTYVVHTCRMPSGADAPIGGWEFAAHNTLTDKMRNACWAGGALEFQMLAAEAHSAKDDVRETYTAPPSTDIAAYSIWRTVQLESSYNYYLFEISPTGTYTTREQCLGGCGGLGVAEPFNAANLVRSDSSSNVSSLQLRLTCGIPDDQTGSCPATKPAARAWLHRADITLRDNAAPQLAPQSPSGTLVNSSQPLAGAQPVTISATDAGGGVYQAAFEVDGKVVDAQTINTNGGRCVPPFTQAVPCLPSASATLRFDTSRVPDGQHTLRVLVTDATGTNTAAWGPTTITTANASCNPDPATSSLKMRVGAVRGRRTVPVVTARYGRRVRVRGQLLNPDGSPVASAEVCVAARTDLAHASLRILGTSTLTDANGNFSFLVPAGPSQRLYFVHRGSDGAATGTVLQRVRASVAMTTSRRSLRTGHTVTFRGRLRGRPVPRRGVLVQIQARRPTGWQTFGTATTNRRGRFRFRYRFVRTRGVQRYTFRALVQRQATYPYTTGTSRRVPVRVSG
jgi:hypothetical protein